MLQKLLFRRQNIDMVEDPRSVHGVRNVRRMPTGHHLHCVASVAPMLWAARPSFFLSGCCCSGAVADICLFFLAS